MKRKIIYLICYLAYSSIYIARVNLSMASPTLVSTEMLDTEKVGLLFGAFAAVFAVGRLINGIFSDKAQPFIMISGGLLLCALSNILFGFFPPFIGMLLLWSVNAYAQSMLWGSMISMMSTLYDESTAKKRTAFLSTTVAVGNIIGILLCIWLVANFGVKYAFIIPGIITLVLGFVALFAMHGVSPCGGDKKHLTLQELLCNKELCTLCVPAFLHGILKENISNWMAMYVFVTYTVDLGSSAYSLLLIPAFGFVGRVVHQVLYRCANENEHRVSFVGFAMAVAFSLMLVFKVSALYSVLCLTMLYGVISMINTSFLSIYPHRYRHEGNVSSVGGIIDFVTYLGAAAGSVLYGTLIKHFGYSAMFISFAIFSMLGMIIIFKFADIKRGKKQ